MQKKFAYHVTSIENIKSIISKGLEPRIGDRSKSINSDGVPLENEKRVYFFPNKNSLENALCNWLGEALDDIDIAILKIDITGLVLKSDVKYELSSREVILSKRVFEIYNEDWSILK